MWYLFSLLALLAWSGSDLFTKIGSRQKDRTSHWKAVVAVGFIMGLHFFITLVGGAIIDKTVGVEALPKVVASLLYTDFRPVHFLRYLPVALLYIGAMVLGYIGLRYIELSISSPICNCSGALAFLLCLLFGLTDKEDVTPLVIVGVALVTVGIVALGIVERNEDDLAKAARQEGNDRKYEKSLLAFLLPVAYLVIDALGTVGDEWIFTLTDRAGEAVIGDYAANSAYELTFFLIALGAAAYLKFAKREPIFATNRAMFVGGVCETVGQVFYMAVMFSDFSVGMVIISAYCALSVVWSRIFLKEKLSLWHYAAIAVTFAGIVCLGDA